MVDMSSNQISVSVSCLHYAAPSGAPRDVVANAVSPRAIRVTWSDVPTDQRNGTLLQYQVCRGARYVHRL